MRFGVANNFRDAHDEPSPSAAEIAAGDRLSVGTRVQWRVVASRLHRTFASPSYPLFRGNVQPCMIAGTRGGRSFARRSRHADLYRGRPQDGEGPSEPQGVFERTGTRGENPRGQR